ncbi:phospholipase D [Xylariaceae sp. FL1651]|nr:phospholipase D [Xylariaceae sp. FL1651]
MKTDYYLNLCLEQAKLFPLHHRHGCIVVKGGKVIGKGFNDYRLSFDSGALKTGHLSTKSSAMDKQKMDNAKLKAKPEFKPVEATVGLLGGGGHHANNSFSMHSEMMAINSALTSSSTLAAARLSHFNPSTTAVRDDKRKRQQRREVLHAYAQRICYDALGPQVQQYTGSVSVAEWRFRPSIHQCNASTSPDFAEAQTKKKVQQQMYKDNKYKYGKAYKAPHKPQSQMKLVHYHRSLYLKSKILLVVMMVMRSLYLGDQKDLPHRNALGLDTVSHTLWDRKEYPKLRGADVYVVRLGGARGDCEHHKTSKTSAAMFRCESHIPSTNMSDPSLPTAAKAGLTGSLYDELICKEPRRTTLPPMPSRATKTLLNRSNVLESRPCYRCVLYMHSAGIRRCYWSNSESQWESAKVRDLFDQCCGINGGSTGFGNVFVTKHEILMLHFPQADYALSHEVTLTVFKSPENPLPRAEGSLKYATFYVDTAAGTMTPLDRDDSISPMTMSPGTTSPIPNRLNQLSSLSHTSTSSAPHLDVVPVRDRPISHSDLSKLAEKLDNDEAQDYLNAGRPHENHSPRNGSNQSSPGRPSSTQFLSPKRNAPIRVPEQDETIPEEPVSPGRRSVQFARADTVLDPPRLPHSRHESWDDTDTANRSRSERWMSRLKSSLSTTATTQPPKAPALTEHGASSSGNSPTMTRSYQPPDTLNEEEGSDADVEESGEESQPREAPKMKKRKRMKRRLKQLDVFTAPNTPRPEESGSPGRSGRLQTMVRRSTMPDSVEHRAGLSEGEGRDQLTGRRPGWRRGNSWISTQRNDIATGEEVESPQVRTPGHRRRISEMFSAGGASDGEALNVPRRPFLSSERAATFGAQRWKQVKHTLRMLGKKKTDQFDFYKSAELMAELRAVTPAVVILASMLQRDEHGNKRIPVLLEQLNIRVTDSYPEDSTSERHSMFTISLEYGSGLSRMTWTVTRSIREIWNMHWKYRLSLKNDRPLQASTNQRGRPKQPAFPRKAFPYLRSYQNRDESDEDERVPGARADETAAEGTAGEGTAAEGTASDFDRRPNASRKKSRINTFLPRRQSSGLGDGREGSMLNPQNAAALQRRYIEKQRKTLEKYLQDMIHWLMFRPDSNRLCKFLELSALGVRLAAEGSFHGKECYLHIQSTKGIDFRRVLTPQKVISRHSRKWFLVRQNYIAVVESPATMNIYDVYLVDPLFRIESKKSKLKWFGKKIKGDTEKGKGKETSNFTDEDIPEKHHTLKIFTAERKIKLFSRNQTILRQFEQSVIDMLKQTQWAEPHRFGSFAPVRTNAFAQWLVDGRDYMWNVSRAISMAQDVIYIHDWWLSPELYMRRPACISQKWRLDRLLQRKAKEGVKVFVIVYRNVEQAIPIDSEYTKFSLLNLHDNIMVLRSPNQLKKNQFFYAHHEKICIVDHDVAFVGGIDLCFGRWDNPQHPINDDRPTGMEPDGDAPRDAEHCQLFPGKDYSNPRVLDFFKLNEPYAEMYDRSRVPRMPWHDIAMQVVGQPARDLTRHFVQRWNYLRRERKPTRPTPFLLPPPDATPVDLEALGLSGTCEVQILRSAGDWSLGFPKDVREHSILTAYVKLIEESEHFVYMENQFFITSTETLNTKVINRIGDALVERILRAHQNDEEWRCCILIPLMPGFQNTVDQAEGSSVRLIMQFQYRSICRGPHSIFGRLEAANINPEDYISFFSLRNWGHMGKKNALVTEQLYIHAKTIVVDDRVALIGSANINERSMLGNRDSETAAIVRDTEMMWSEMGGERYQVGRFAHTLRMRLMREHLGLDVDAITEQERQAEISAEAEFEAEMSQIYDDDYQGLTPESSANAQSSKRLGRPGVFNGRSFNHDTAGAVDPANTRSSSSSSSSSTSSGSSKSKSTEHDTRVYDNASHNEDVEGYGADHWKDAQAKGDDLGSDSAVLNGHEVLLYRSGQPAKSPPKDKHDGSTQGMASEAAQDQSSGKGNEKLPPAITRNQSQLPAGAQLAALPVLDDTDIGGPSVHLDDAGRPSFEPSNPLLADITPAQIDKDCMRDPVNPAFWDDIWMRVARNNTILYRRVFRCMPDSEVSTWKDYHEFNEYAHKFAESMFGSENEDGETKPQTTNAGGAAVGIAVPAIASASPDVVEKLQAEKVHVEHETGPTVPVINGGLDTPNEKTSLPDFDHAADAKQSALNLESEKGTIKHPLEASSLIQPTGEVPFPLFDGQSEGTHLEPQSDEKHDRRATFSASEKSAPDSNHARAAYNQNSMKRRRRATTKSSRRGPIFPYDVLSREDAEELCSMIQGHLVQFPYDWLEAEEKDNHWLYQADLLAPKEI